MLLAIQLKGKYRHLSFLPPHPSLLPQGEGTKR